MTNESLLSSESDSLFFDPQHVDDDSAVCLEQQHESSFTDISLTGSDFLERHLQPIFEDSFFETGISLTVFFSIIGLAVGVDNADDDDDDEKNDFKLGII